ncbi:hypothetical protein [Arthrobacter antioxidans]|uniref:hypothetical protein n=1 Tax=Arthrobacter antioxidans TaxID=2895818 RepID=UPI001FFF7753|nr:hypothetical protein [Arthrobacter antioxidans]
MSKHTPEEQRQRTLHAIHSSGLGLQDVWVRYFSFTGDVDEFEVNAYLNGLITLTPLDRDLVSLAVNELIAETPPPTAPYSNDSEDPGQPDVLVALDVLDHRDDGIDLNEGGGEQDAPDNT